ncbi:hypothetical protein ACBV55_09440 [Franconibacter pulveris]
MILNTKDLDVSKKLLKVGGVVVDVKKYYKGYVDFIAGEGIILNEFIGEVATRQINILHVTI